MYKLRIDSIVEFGDNRMVSNSFIILVLSENSLTIRIEGKKERP